MRIAEALDMAERYIREQPSSNPVLVAFRGDDTIAIVDLAPHHRDEVVQVAVLMAGGYGADILVLVTDTWTATEPLNPLTGKEWEPDDMSTLARDHDGVAKGWVTDTMMGHVINRAGDQAITSMPYRMEGDEYVWGETTRLVAGEDGEMGGALAHGFARAMSAPQLATTLAEMGSTEILGDAETTRAVLDCSVTAKLLEADCVQGVAMPAESDTPRANIIRNFLRSSRARQS